MSLSEEPARKLFVNQCGNLILNDNQENSRHKKWSVTHNKKCISVGLVWIQGIIIKVSEFPDVITLDDGSDQAVVISVKEAPGYGSWIQKGQYAMVIGEVLAVKPEVKVKALKLTHLEEPNSEILWILEVLDFWKFLTAR